MPDHHWMIRTQPPMTDLCTGYSDSLYRNRLQSLIGVDVLVEAVADKLLTAGLLDSTYFLYTSDHGFHLGEMRVPFFKVQPYDTDLNVPFMVRGPGIAAGSKVHALALNVDVAPTIAALFHTEPPPESLTDGRSLLPLLFTAPAGTDGGGTSGGGEWRKDFLFEFWEGNLSQVGGAKPGGFCNHIISAANNTYQGVRTADGLKLVDFSNRTVYPNANSEDIEEAFNLTADPWEMNNLAKDPASQPWVNRLRARLAELRNCNKAGCW